MRALSSPSNPSQSLIFNLNGREDAYTEPQSPSSLSNNEDLPTSSETSIHTTPSSINLNTLATADIAQNVDTASTTYEDTTNDELIARLLAEDDGTDDLESNEAMDRTRRNEQQNYRPSSVDDDPMDLDIAPISLDTDEAMEDLQLAIALQLSLQNYNAKLQAQKSTPRTTQRESQQSSRRTGNDCPICLERFSRNAEANNEQITHCPGCVSPFHSTCLERWFREAPTCPKCRVNLSEIHLS